MRVLIRRFFHPRNRLYAIFDPSSHQKLTDLISMRNYRLVKFDYGLRERFAFIALSGEIKAASWSRRLFEYQFGKPQLEVTPTQVLEF